MTFVTVVTVLRDGRHVLHQLHVKPERAAFVVAAHMATRQQHYGADVIRFVIVRGTVVSHQEAQQP